MRSFGSLALKQVRARRLRAVLTVAGIILGVGMVFGVLTLSATIRGTFRDLFDSVYGRTDVVISGRQGTGSLPARRLAQVRATDGVAAASANITNVWTLVGADGKAKEGPSGQLNVGGIDPKAVDLTASDTVAGRDVRGGREIDLQQSWAQANGFDVGNRITLATPAGVAHLRVVGLFQFSTGLDFGGQGFAKMPIAAARPLMGKRHVYDEIDVVADGTGDATIAALERRLRGRLGNGVEITTPEARSKDIDKQLQGFDVILIFFAGMALFVGGFLIFNAFNMTVLQRMREIGMLRTLGATRSLITRSVLREALILGVAGSILGLGLGVLLAKGLVALLKGLDFPVGGLEVKPGAAAAALAVGLVTTVAGVLAPARRAGRIAPIRAILGAGQVRDRPRPRRAALGAVLIAAGGIGAYRLAAAASPGAGTVAGGLIGIVALFFGIALIAPFAITPMVRVMSWPLRHVFGVEGRLAADSASSSPKRTAATSTALTIGLALVVAFGTLGSSFLGTISDEFDHDFARDLTIQPRGFAPGQGPQQTIAPGLRDKLARIPEAKVVARERIHFAPDLPRPPGSRHKIGGLIFGFDPSQYKQVDQTDIKGASRDRAFRDIVRGEVTVGEAYADNEHLKVGDPIVLRGPSGRDRTRVAGIVKTVVFGGNTVGMSTRTMRRVYGIDADSQLAIAATSAAARPALERKVHAIVDRAHPNLQVLSKEQLKADIERQVNQQFGFFNAILGVAVIVSLFGIINTLTMSVIERTREIGVLRALGSTRWQVRRSIVDESLLIALIGTALGIAVGAALGWVMLKGIAASVPGAGYRPPVATIVSVAFVGVVLGLLASILPARRAARLDVIDALSYE